MSIYLELDIYFRNRLKYLNIIAEMIKSCIADFSENYFVVVVVASKLDFVLKKILLKSPFAKMSYLWNFVTYKTCTLALTAVNVVFLFVFLFVVVVVVVFIFVYLVVLFCFVFFLFFVFLFVCLFFFFVLFCFVFCLFFPKHFTFWRYKVL